MEKNKMPIILTMASIISLVVGVFVGKNLGQSSPKDTAINLSAPRTNGSCGLEGNGEAPEGVISLKGVVLKTEQLPVSLQDGLYEVDHQSYEKKNALLEEFGLRWYLAKEKGKAENLNEIPATLDLLSISEVSEKELKEFFNKNKDRMPPGSTFEAIKPQLSNFLKMQKGREVYQAKLDEVKKGNHFQILLTSPLSPQINLDTKDLPSIGPKDSKNVLVEASDYLCGHCKNMHPTVQKALKELDGKIRFVPMNFSLRPDGTSGKMIQGAYCAQKQSADLYLKYHKNAFEYEGQEEPNPIEIGKISGVEADSFKKCLDSEEAKEYVKKTNEKLSSIGVSGTPTFFLNNRKIHVGEEDMVKVIKENLVL